MRKQATHRDNCCFIFPPPLVIVITTFQGLMRLIEALRHFFPSWNINRVIFRTDKHHGSVVIILWYQSSPVFVTCLSSHSCCVFCLSSRFVSPQTGSSSRYMGQQNSPVPSPYTPQSPATGYIQPFPHQQPPSYNQHQQIQQGKSLFAAKMWRDRGRP